MVSLVIAVILVLPVIAVRVVFKVSSSDAVLSVIPVIAVILVLPVTAVRLVFKVSGSDSSVYSVVSETSVASNCSETS